jgi:DNA-binding transcriptional LysR family regulator
MVHYTLKQLAYFSAVAEQGGIAQAARVLNISQPAVAFALDKLEELLGIKLLARHHARGAELTPEGREVLALSRRLLRAAEEADRAFKAIAADVTGHLRLGCFHTLAPVYVPGLVKAVGVRHPGVKLDLTEARHDELLAALTERSVDIALIYAMELDDTALAFESVKTIEPYVLLPEGHPLATRKTVGITALADEPYVQFDWPGTREYFEVILRTAGIDPQIAFRSQSYELVRGAVANGLGFSLLNTRPKTDVTYDGKRIACRPIKERVPPLDIVVAWPKSAGPSPLREAFLDLAHEYFADVGG